MTEQEVFDFVYKFIIKQGRGSYIRSKSGIFKCRYRSPKGLKCAAGCLIGDEDWEKLNLRRYESQSSFVLADIFPTNHPMNEHEGLIEGLQCCHDQAVWDSYDNTDRVTKKTHEFFIQRFKVKMKLLADRCRLTVPQDV